MSALLVAAALAASPGDLPTLTHSKSSGFEGARVASGFLAKAFCFTQPTRICVPAGSWVWMEWSVCGRRSGPGCDDTHVTPRLHAVDATADLEAFGYRWARKPHHEPKEDETASYTFQFDTEVSGQLATPATIDGTKLLPGPTRFSRWVRDGTVEEHVLSGVWAEAHTCEGWTIPAGTTFSGECGKGLSLVATTQARIERSESANGEPLRVSRLAVYGDDEEWLVREPVTLLGHWLVGEIAVRHVADGGYDFVRGDLPKRLVEGGCTLPKGATLVLNGDGTVRAMPDSARCPPTKQ